MKWYEFSVVLMLGFCLAVWVYDPLLNDKKPVFENLVVDEVERWHDLNNKVARDKFCQAKGYSSSVIIDYTFGTRIEHDFAGSPFGYDILCKGSVPKEQVYNYDTYKRWMLNIVFTNP